MVKEKAYPLDRVDNPIESTISYGIEPFSLINGTIMPLMKEGVIVPQIIPI